MYLSRLILNPASRRVQRELAVPYEMHRSLMRAFPDGLAPGEERILFRADDHPGLGAPALLVQSLDRPDWSWLTAPQASGYLLEIGEPNPAVKSFEPKPAAGQVLSFRLVANPTVKRDGKRLGLYREEEQMAWLARKAVAGGFRILAAHASNKAAGMAGRIHRDGETLALKLLTVQFDGVLQVIDPARLTETLAGGIGSGKGFGCGLLSLAPAR